MSLYLDAFYQCFRIPKPALTEENLPDQSGRVFIITGASTGCGYALTQILYSKNGTVYLAGRSQPKAEAAITQIKAANPSSDGRLEFLPLDLADLTSVKAAAEAFLSREQRLDVLTNNAGVMQPPKGTVSAQGYEVQMGTNCLGAFLFTELLTPLLRKTAASAPKGSVRVTWAASLATLGAPREGVAFDARTGAPKVHGIPGMDYSQSKAGNVLQAREYGRRHAGEGVVSCAWNPGNLDSELMRYYPTWVRKVFRWVLLYPAVYGAYTELWAGWAEEAAGGRYVVPWGRVGRVRGDLEESANAGKFWEWCEEETRGYVS